MSYVLWPSFFTPLISKPLTCNFNNDSGWPSLGHVHLTWTIPQEVDNASYGCAVGPDSKHGMELPWLD